MNEHTYIFSIFSILIDALKYLSQLITTRREMIYLFSSCVAALFAYIFLSSVYNLRKDEWERPLKKWETYFGTAFLIFTFQYLCRWFVLVLFPNIPSDSSINLVRDSIVAFCSGANNLMFLSAAMILFGKKNIFPRWAIVWAIFNFMLGLFENSVYGVDLIYKSIIRFPDAVLSALCLTLFGYAAASQISYRYYSFWSIIPILVGGSYAVLQLVYAFTPLIAAMSSEVESSSVWLDTLDTIIFGVALPFKFGLFLPVYTLQQQQQLHLNNLKGLLKEVTEGQQEFISQNGLVKEIGCWLEADAVDLSIRLSGKDQLRIASIEWNGSEVYPQNNKTIVKVIGKANETDSSSQKTVADPVISWGITRVKPFIYPYKKYSVEKVAYFFSRLLRLKSNQADSYKTNIPIEVYLELQKKLSIMMVPIRYQNATIGCIKIERQYWVKGSKIRRFLKPFEAADVKLADHLMTLIAPSVQSFRELAALDLYNDEISKIDARKQFQRISDIVDKLATILRFIFSTEGLRLDINLGFSHLDKIYKGEKNILSELRKYENFAYDNLPKEINVDRTKYKVFKSKLKIRGDKGEEIVYGNLLIIFLQKDNDTNTIEEGEKKPPSLGSNYLHRRTLASAISEDLLSFVSEYFSEQLKHLGVNLTKERLSTQAWYDNIEKTTLKVGLDWIAAETDDRWFGNREKISIVEKISKTSSSNILAKVNERITSYTLNPPIDNTYHIIKLTLSTTNKHIWMGVNRREFGPEWKSNLPWRAFLEHLSEISDSTLVRFAAAKEVQRLQLEAVRHQNLFAITATTGTLAHQLVNLGRNQHSGLSALENQLKASLVGPDGDTQRFTKTLELLKSMKESAEQQFQLLKSLSEATTIDNRRPCNLLKTVQRAEALFQIALLQKGIKLHLHFGHDISINIPFSVVSLALANLIGNALDAMEQPGAIIVKATETETEITCQVIDEGTGIKLENKQRIFDLGFSTKKDSGGWGLYLVQRTLMEHGARIELTDTGVKGSTFTVYFPKLTSVQSRLR